MLVVIYSQAGIFPVSDAYSKKKSLKWPILRLNLLELKYFIEDTASLDYSYNTSAFIIFQLQILILAWQERHFS
ncbi:hypothetical protein [Sulfurimonas sp.]|uniref:hypothetical protein n=1 Tax=Sulfurimonas sp. TaxID=2022749 RepID=UPI0039E70F07